MEKNFFFKKDKTFQNLKKDMSLPNMINEAKFVLDTIIIKFQNTRYKEIVKRFRGRRINRLPKGNENPTVIGTTNSNIRCQQASNFFKALRILG